MSQFTVVKGPINKQVVGKLAGLRKERRFSVSPCSDGEILVQARGVIGKFDFRTRKGMLNTRGEYFPHLSPALGAREFEFPAEFVTACLDACPAQDSETRALGGVFENTIQIIGPSGDVIDDATGQGRR